MKSASSTTPSPRGTRLRKKKRLDAICESVYKRNHSEPSPRVLGDNVGSVWDEGLELRRSSRVRRVPVVLDASPPPVKKRKKRGKRVELSRGVKGKVGKVKEEEVEGEEEEEEEEDEDLGTLGDWRSRLRSRSRGLKGETSRKRKLFEDEEEDEEEEEEDEGKLVVVRSKRPGRIKALSGLGSRENEGEGEERCGGNGECVEEEDGIELGADEGVENDVMFVSEGDSGNEEDNLVFLGERDVGNQNDATFVGELGGGDEVEEPSLVGQLGVENEEAMDVEAGELQVDSEEREERLVGLCSEPRSDKDEDVKVEDEEWRNNEGEDLANVMDKEKEKDAVQINDGLVNEIKGGEEGVDEEVPVILPTEVEKVANAYKLKHASVDAPRKTRIKQGRRCGLCGCGNDGKPPKKLVQDAGNSDNEAYSGSSASEETNYDVWDGFGDEPEWLGQLLGPINDRFGIAGIWVHQHCAVWSPEVYFAGLGRLKNVRAALCRGRALKCSRCGRPGATIGCRVDRCPKTYHLPCARANGCIFDHRKFLIACTDHRHLFQPHGNQYLMQLKKLKAKKMKLEIRKQSNEACRKDVEDEERWLEKCGEDEEFLKRESKRLHRDLLRIAPVYIGGSGAESGKLFEGWESVAGLQDVIQCMKEVVLIPLLYPEFFSNLGITPPRGVLLHGHPGTGKTLVVRALIGSCARGDKRIAYFARKGADCLGKYVGDAERQLRLLFQVAERCQPSIIFFDEIDGLAPCRTRQQDQTHSSVVSTLLALMDGLKSRGSVIVIGATNRPEAVDPALRRPGRFDREIYFPLPSVEDRAAILSLHTKRWPKPVCGSLLDWVARKTFGFAGADLQALCTQAAIIALKRNFPLQEVLSAAGEVAPGGKRSPLPAFAVEERDWLEALVSAPPPCSRRVDRVSIYDFVSYPLPAHLIPCLLRPLLILLVSLHLDERLWLPNSLAYAARMVKSVTLSLLQKRNLPIDDWWCHLGNILEEADVAKKIHRRLSHTGILVGQACSAGSDTSTDKVEHADNLEPTNVHCGGMQTSLFGSPSFTSGRRSGFRVLIAGSTGFGQRHLASCILQCFVGNIEIYKIDLATFSHEGHGDIVQGITQILLKCVSLSSCMIFMPRIDLWAVETFNHITEETEDVCEMESSSPQSQIIGSGNQLNLESSKAAETAENQAVAIGVSQTWRSLIEQLESTCVSTSLMILATSELPFQALPNEIRQFFKGDISSSHNSTSLQHAVPRFPVHLDGHFSLDAVIRLSAAELLRDLMQSFVQLVHQRTHTHARPLLETNVFCSSQYGPEAEPHTKGEAKVLLTRDSSIGVPPTPNSRSLRGKPTLLLAMSTFGYQILLYPHFAELCWFTSKLKEGPLADVSEPWKGWPFNSCIIRPNNSLDEAAVACSATAIKTNRLGVVRGLMAVGLLAYRGHYKSLREVSFEVRKVLELLVGQIGERIQSGKDRYQYVRLLSQVAYLEDMVNNWVYTLQSLEVGAQINVADSKPNPMELSENHSCIVSVQGEECRRNASDRSYLEGEFLELDLTKLTPENLEDEAEQEDNLGNTDGTGAHDVLCDDNVLDNNDETMAAAELFGKQNGLTHELSDPEVGKNFTVSNGNCESPKHSDGFMSKEAGLSSDNGLPNSGKVHNLESSGGNSCNDMNGLHKVEGEMRSCVEPDGSGHVEMSCAASNVPCFPESGITCLYHCCSRCVYMLYDMLKKILLAKWGSPAGNCSVEDVHDVVSSLSLELLSAIRKVASAESEDMMLTTQASCHCEGPGNRLLAAMECCSHSVDDCVTATTNYEDLHCRLDADFVLRDGVIVPVDSNRDVSFHCIYDSLCLGSLGKSILMSKLPLD